MVSLSVVLCMGLAEEIFAISFDATSLLQVSSASKIKSAGADDPIDEDEEVEEAEADAEDPVTNPATNPLAAAKLDHDQVKEHEKQSVENGKEDAQAQAIEGQQQAKGQVAEMKGQAQEEAQTFSAELNPQLEPAQRESIIDNMAENGEQMAMQDGQELQDNVAQDFENGVDEVGEQMEQGMENVAGEMWGNFRQAQQEDGEG